MIVGMSVDRYSGEGPWMAHRRSWRLTYSMAGQSAIST